MIELFEVMYKFCVSPANSEIAILLQRVEDKLGDYGFMKVKKGL